MDLESQLSVVKHGWGWRGDAAGMGLEDGRHTARVKKKSAVQQPILCLDSLHIALSYLNHVLVIKQHDLVALRNSTEARAPAPIDFAKANQMVEGVAAKLDSGLASTLCSSFQIGCK